MSKEQIPWWELPGAPGENRTKEQYQAAIAALKEPNPNRRPIAPTGAAKLFYELWQSAERQLNERPSRSEMVALVAAIIQDEAQYDPTTNTWDIEKAAADIVTAFETA